MGLKGVTDVDTDPKGGFLSFRVTLFNNRVLCVFTTSGHSTREQLVRAACLVALILLWVKWIRIVKKKHKVFTDIALKVQDTGFTLI